MIHREPVTVTENVSELVLHGLIGILRSSWTFNSQVILTTVITLECYWTFISIVTKLVTMRTYCRVIWASGFHVEEAPGFSSLATCVSPCFHVWPKVLRLMQYL